MRRVFGLLASFFVIALIGSFAWSHKDSAPIPVTALAPATTQPVEDHAEIAEEAQARDIVTITGPLADYMSRRQPNAQKAASEPAHFSRSIVPSDHVGDSPVGTSAPILHKTFLVAKAANLAFEIPAHASNPTLRGTYSSFRQGAGMESDDDVAVEFLLLNAQQYANFLSQRPSDALFSADGAHDQEINVSMPPTMNQPVKYYLLFRNDTADAKKVAVQADLRVDF
jgi:hypothetical protein